MHRLRVMAGDVVGENGGCLLAVSDMEKVVDAARFGDFGAEAVFGGGPASFGGVLHEAVEALPDMFAEDFLDGILVLEGDGAGIFVDVRDFLETAGDVVDLVLVFECVAAPVGLHVEELVVVYVGPADVFLLGDGFSRQLDDFE